MKIIDCQPLSIERLCKFQYHTDINGECDEDLIEALDSYRQGYKETIPPLGALEEAESRLAQYEQIYSKMRDNELKYTRFGVMSKSDILKKCKQEMENIKTLQPSRSPFTKTDLKQYLEQEELWFITVDQEPPFCVATNLGDATILTWFDAEYNLCEHVTSDEEFKAIEECFLMKYDEVSQ